MYLLPFPLSFAQHHLPSPVLLSPSYMAWCAVLFITTLAALPGWYSCWLVSCQLHIDAAPMGTFPP